MFIDHIIVQTRIRLNDGLKMSSRHLQHINFFSFKTSCLQRPKIMTSMTRKRQPFSKITNGTYKCIYNNSSCSRNISNTIQFIVYDIHIITFSRHLQSDISIKSGKRNFPDVNQGITHSTD